LISSSLFKNADMLKALSDIILNRQNWHNHSAYTLSPQKC
jgi:hypothetical protein